MLFADFTNGIFGKSSRSAPLENTYVQRHRTWSNWCLDFSVEANLAKLIKGDVGDVFRNHGSRTDSLRMARPKQTKFHR